MTVKLGPKLRIGVLGDGQLAMMLGQKIQKLGFQFHVITENKNSPAAKITPYIFNGNIHNSEDVLAFSKSVDLLTLENEFIDIESLKLIDDKKLFPSSTSFELISDKWIEKETFKKIGLPVAPYKLISNPEKDLDAFISLHGSNLVLKCIKGGYDGYGNISANSYEDAIEAYHQLVQHSDVIVEKKINFVREISVLVCNNGLTINCYEPIDTFQENQICHFVSQPSRQSTSVIKLAKKLSMQAIQKLNYKGLLCLEFFVTKEGSLILNESAPRPHNSGHITMDSCHCDQFENHIRSILSLPLGKTEMKTSAAYMVNLLGSSDGEYSCEDFKNVLEVSDTFIHMYGKELSRPGRKMGHINIIGEDLNNLLNKAHEIKDSIKI